MEDALDLVWAVVCIECIPVLIQRQREDLIVHDLFPSLSTVWIGHRYGLYHLYELWDCYFLVVL